MSVQDENAECVWCGNLIDQWYDEAGDVGCFARIVKDEAQKQGISADAIGRILRQAIYRHAKAPGWIEEDKQVARFRDRALSILEGDE